MERISFWRTWLQAFGVIAVACVAPSLAVGAAKDAGAPKPVTFSKDIAPILWKNCAGCHRAGEVGPFSLLSYADASKRAEFLAEVTTSRRMPPWKPEPGFGKFQDERRLMKGEIELIAQWAGAGAPEGAAKDLPEPPTFPEGWQLGEPEMVLKMPGEFSVPAGGRDIYRCFVIPIPAEKDRVVSAVEFRPGNRRVVHHAIMYLDANGQARKKDGRDGRAGFASFGGPGIVPTGGLGGWAPGMTPHVLPDGMVRYLRKGSDLVLQVHYHPSGKPETDLSQVGIHFSKQPIKKIVTGIAVLQTNLNIPANEAHCQVTAESQELPVNAHVVGVTPHMHNLGREIKVTAIIPDREKEMPLVWIKDWDFNWQGAYQFQKPIDLPKGSKIKIVAVYDNSSNNPKNPNVPPKDVHWGEQTTDEMCLCGVQVFTDKITELKQIAEMRDNELGAGLEGGIPGKSEAMKKQQLAKTEAAKKAAAKKRSSAKKDATDDGESESASATTTATAPTTSTADAPAVNPPADNQAAADDKEKPKPQAAAKAGKKSAAFPNELVIPESAKSFFGQYDLNGDGKLTRDEFDKIPPDSQRIILQVLRRSAKK